MLGVFKKHTYGKRLGGCRGAALFELAIVAPVLVILLAGTVDIGRLMLSYIAATRAAYEGTRYAANIRAIPVDCWGPVCTGPAPATTPPTILSVFDRVRIILREQSLLTGSDTTVNVEQDAVGEPRYISTTVRVQYEPIFGMFFSTFIVHARFTGPSLFPDSF